MKPLTKFTAKAAPIPGRNIDTDQIIPARFLKKNRSLEGGYAPYLFYDLSHDAAGLMDEHFVLNTVAYRDARILIAEHNFGCGSSREGAVYALADRNFQAVLASSFGDIFYNNCLKNGVLPVRLPEEVIADLLAQAQAQAQASGQGVDIEVDLEYQTVSWKHSGLTERRQHSFDIDHFWRECLLKGVDEVELTLSYRKEIEMFEAQYMLERPWLEK